MSVSNVIASVLILAGCLLAMIGGIGVLRFPDVFARMHAATKPPTLGLVLVAVGAMLRESDVSDVSLLALVVGLQFLTAPVGAHLVGRAAYASGGLMAEDTVIDELADVEDSDESDSGADDRETADQGADGSRTGRSPGADGAPATSDSGPESSELSTEDE